MAPHTLKGASALVALALILVVAGIATAGDDEFQSNFGTSFFGVSPPCPVKRFQTFESLAPVPGLVDPFAEDLIPVFCSISVTKEGEGVKKAKGKFTAELIVLDNNTGMAESFDVGSGTFSTDKGGSADFAFDLPAELFADGFESGDVSAWSYTRTDFTNRKKATLVSQSCGTSKGGSSSP